MLGDLLEPYRGLFDRRAHARHSVDASARVWTSGEPDPLVYEMNDLSLGGASFSVPPAPGLEQGSYAKLELPIPDGTRLMTTAVKVVDYCSDNGRARVRFLDRSASFRRQVSDATVAWRARA